MHRVDIWHMASTWGKVALILLGIACIAQTAFVLIYARRPWYRVRVGRALMLKSTALLVALWINEVNVWFRYPHQGMVSAFAIGFVAAAVVYQLWVLIREPLAVVPAKYADEDPRHAGEVTPS